MADIAGINPDLFPLSLSQQNIWALERTYPGTSVNNICTTIRIQGRVDFVALQKSLQTVLAADSSLRTRITLQGKTPLQYCVPYREESFPVFDFSQTSSEGVENWEMAVTREPMPLLDAPLYRFVLFRAGEHAGGVLIKIHHIISDGWSQVLLCNRIGQIYLDLLAGREIETAEYPDYRLHVEEEQEYLRSEAYMRDRAYWEEMLRHAGEPSVLKSVKSAAVSPVGRRLSFDLPQTLNHAIYSFCMHNRVSPFLVFYMALAIYFKRIGGADRFTIGVPVFNRADYAFKQTTGMFVSTLPFSSELQDDWSLSDYSDRLSEQWLELLRRAKFPFTEIQRLADSGGREPGRLFNIALSYQDSKILESRDASVLFSGRWHYSGYQAEQLCIHLSNRENHRRYSVDYDYLTQLFSVQEIEAFHNCLVNILHEALSAPDKPIHRLSVLSAAERERVLYTFNNTAQPIYDHDLWAHFARTAEQYPSRAALICNGRRISYSALSEMAEEVSSSVLGACRERNALIAILLPRQEALIASMLGVLRAGDAFLLLSTELPPRRIRDILLQSGAAALLTRRETLDFVGLRELDIPLIDWDGRCSGVRTGPVEARPDELAYVVYTSGSTGAPKGVEIMRRSLMNLTLAMAPVYGNGAVLSLCNIGFDAFLLESAAAILNGRTVILPGEEELESPRALAALMKSYGVGFISLTPSRLTALMREPDFVSAMEGLESIVCGGEAFPSDLLQRLSLCTRARIYNQYGPSETTVAVSQKLLNGSKEITAGAPMPNCRLYVLDDWMNPLPVGVYGKLYVGGLCVGRGYRNAPELTAASFTDSPFELGDRLYNTGDIACWTAAGDIMLAGRVDRQVKLRGLRVEPQEVASCLASHPGVREAAARVFEQNGQVILVGYYTADTAIAEAELLSYAASYLPRYMVPAAILRLDALPLSPSGKIDESLLPPPASGGGAARLPASELQSKLLAIFREVLQRDEMGVADDYFQSGGDSLNAMEAIALVSERLGLSLRIADLYACRNVLRLAELLGDDTARAENAVRLAPAPALERYPLTPIQQGIYVQSYLDKTGILYNMPGAFRLPQSVEPARLRDAFQAIIDQDDIFRTSFIQEADGVYAHIAPHVTFELPMLCSSDFKDACKTFVQPFDLSAPPLIRAALWLDAEQGTVLFIDMHHIIADGLTTPLLLERLRQFHAGQKPDFPSITYKDYAYALANRPATETDKSYWREYLSPLPDDLDLPCDFQRPHARDYKGASQYYSFTPELSAKIGKVCSAEGITPFTLLLGAFGVLLSAVSGKTDFSVGIPISERDRPELSQVCGPLLTTMPIRMKPQPDKTLSIYLSEIRDQVTGMLTHRSCSPDLLISELGLNHSLSGNPLYQVIFSLRPFGNLDLSLGGEELTYLPISTDAAKADLGIEAAMEQGVCTLRLEYSTSLFADATIAFYARCLETIVEAMVSGNYPCLSDLPTMSDADRFMLIEKPIYTCLPYLNQPIHMQIRTTALRHEDDTAVIFRGKTTTYIQIEKRACQIANMLSEAGIQRGEHVALCAARNPDFLCAMLAILKIGCAYVPLLSSYPENRIFSILEDANIRFIVSDKTTSPKLPNSLLGRLLLLENATGQETFKEVKTVPGDLINILFTSGSTGKPKGVMIRHSSVSNLLAAMRDAFGADNGPMLSVTPPIFDIYLTESLIAMALGRTIILADEEEMLLPWKMAELIEANKATFIQFTASRLQMCLSNEAFCRAAAGLKFTIVGGEPVSELLVSKFKSCCSGRLVNLYGPTEATVYTTMTDLEVGQRVTIGQPLPNTRVYIMDNQGKPIIPTAVGEMYLAGAGVAVGYVSRPDLTEASFLPDPFFPGERMYRSGDFGRLRVDGCIEFLGRRDTQIKLNGQRVELDEITGAVLGSGLADQGVTVPLFHPDGTAELASFYVPAPDKPVDNEQLMERLKEVLPSFMVPSHLIPVKEMPRTDSSKIDLQALKQLVTDRISGSSPEENKNSPITAGNTLYPESLAETKPIPEEIHTLELLPPSGRAFNSASVSTPLSSKPSITAEELLAIWAQSLQRGGLQPDVSFFEQGGTSLAALNVLSQYHNRGLVMSLEQFYENPTALRQAALLRSAGGSVPAFPEGATVPAAPSLVSVEEQRRRSSLREVPPLPADSERPLGTVLLTGATGFLGAHVLRALLEAGADCVLCAMRDGKEERLLDALAWYFGSGWAQSASARVEIVRGDVGRYLLGLPRPEYNALCARVDSVWHCADVRAGADSEEVLRVNVTGTETAVALAKAAGASLYHMSAAGVAGERLLHSDERELFTERDFDIGQDLQDDLYLQSKYLAEAAVLNAVRHGLPARLFRVGRLVGRASDGVFQRNRHASAFCRFLHAVRALGAVPRSAAGSPVDLMPVDVCAEAAVALRNSPMTAYHLMNPTPPTLEQAVRAVAPAVSVLSDDEFSRLLNTGVAEGHGEQLSPLLEFWRRLQSAPPRIEISCELTAAELKRLGFDGNIPGANRLLREFAPETGKTNARKVG